MSGYRENTKCVIKQEGWMHYAILILIPQSQSRHLQRALPGALRSVDCTCITSTVGSSKSRWSRRTKTIGNGNSSKPETRLQLDIERSYWLVRATVKFYSEYEKILLNPNSLPDVARQTFRKISVRARD